MKNPEIGWKVVHRGPEGEFYRREHEEAWLYFIKKLEERRLAVFLRQRPQFKNKQEVDAWFEKLAAASFPF